MKREFITGLLPDISKEVLDQIMAENGKDIEAEKAKTAAKEGELVVANDTIKQLQDAVKEFDGVDIAKLQDDMKTLQEKYNDDIEAEGEKAVTLKKEYELKDKLREAGVTDPEYLIFKHGGVDKFAYNKENSPIGLEETIKPYRETMPHIFKTDQMRTEYTPAGGGSGGVKNPWTKETLNLTEQGKLIKENPEQAKALASAAGIKLNI